MSSGSILRQGFVVGITNPKILVFFVAVLPQFVDPANGNVALQMMLFGLIFVVSGLGGVLLVTGEQH